MFTLRLSLRFVYNDNKKYAISVLAVAKMSYKITSCFQSRLDEISPQLRLEMKICWHFSISYDF